MPLVRSSHSATCDCGGKNLNLHRPSLCVLAEKYRPQRLQDFVGNPEAVKEVIRWLRDWRNEPKKALLLYGPPGAGKSILVELLAKEMGYALVYSSASDVRSAKSLKEQFGAALSQGTLFFKGRLVVFDEVDGLSAADTGAVKEIAELIEATKNPMILVANDPWDQKLRGVRELCQMVQMRKIHASTIGRILSSIATAEKVTADDKVVGAVARRTDGDMKAAINDFEVLAKNRTSIVAADLEVLASRDIERSIFEALRIIFKTETAEVAISALENVEKPLDDVKQWIRENLPSEYVDAKDLASAYDALSRADIFGGRIASRQYWRFQAYAAQLMSAGVATAKSRRSERFVSYQYPRRIMQMGRTKMMRAAEKELALKLGHHLHCSARGARQYFPLLRLMQRKQPAVWKEISEKLGIEELPPAR